MQTVGTGDPKAIHLKLCALAKSRAGADHELGLWLVAAHRARAWASVGYARFGEYIERLFDFDRRIVAERLRVALALETLPRMADALRRGALSWSAVRELSRVATRESEVRWMEHAAGKSARGIERMVSGLKKGADPFDRPSPDAPVRITFEVSPSSRALVDEARERLCAQLGQRVTDDVLIETLARAVLAGERSRDEGQASYQIALTICERCQVATQRSGGEDRVVDAATVECARCDAQELGRVDQPEPANATQTVPPKIRRTVMRRHGGRCAVPGCRHSAFVDLHHIVRQADGGTHTADNLIPLCGAHHRATHVGALVIRGSYSAGLTFQHADGAAYGSPAVSPARASVLATVLELLVGMGWKQRQAQSMLDRIRPHVGHEPEIGEVLRAALREAPVSGASAVREPVAVYERLAA